MSKRARWITLISLSTVMIAASSFYFGADAVIALDSGIRSKIFYELRVPRVLLAFFVGLTLSICGVITQSVLRNPLACPYTLGISQLLSLVLFTSAFVGPQFAVFLALFMVFLAYAFFMLCRNNFAERSFRLRVILAGLAVATFCSSLIVAMQYFIDSVSLLLMTRWLMGSLSVVGFEAVYVMVLIALLLTGVAFRFASDMDLLQIDDEYALSSGVPIRWTTSWLLGMVVLAVGITVYCAGPVGFVGLLVPHIVRLLGFDQHRDIICFSGLIGGSFLMASDTFSRIVIAPAELPIGVVTGLIGTPVFIVLLLGRKPV